MTLGKALSFRNPLKRNFRVAVANPRRSGQLMNPAAIAIETKQFGTTLDVSHCVSMQ
jgi:hypothetical protein